MTEAVVSSGTAKTPAQFGEGNTGKQKRWKAEITVAGKQREPWRTRCVKVVKRYVDERDAANTTEKKFNILWSNVQVLRSALYNKPPKPETNRKFNTTNPVNRVAASIMERNLEYIIIEHSEFDAVLKQVVLDRLLPGQGTAWVRYSANIAPDPAAAAPAAAPADPGYGPVQQPLALPEPAAASTGTVSDPTASITDDAYLPPTEETVCYDYVHWKDWLCSPARTWEEVTWVARRVFLTQDKGVKRFGDVFKKVPLNYKYKQETALGVTQGDNSFGPGPGVIEKAAVWEIWDKDSRKIVWMCEDYTEILDERDDILKLREFFPCPKPLLATVTTDSIIPVPDYCMYQDQGQELDEITNRISLLTKALKVIGVYDKTQAELQRMLTEGVENQMIPVDNWGMFAERGGIKGTVDFFPVELVMEVLEKLINARAVVKQDVYEITGMADIVRGASVASESATAQKLKAKFADVRISESQNDIARFAADLINMTAEIITNIFQPESIILGADMGDKNDPDAPYVSQALALIKNKALIKHRITVSTDAITEQDKEDEQNARIGFLTALGQFMQQAGGLTAEKPELMPLMAQLTLWGVRGFRVGRDVEGALEQAITRMQQAGPPQKEPSPEEKKMQVEMKMQEQELAQKSVLQQQEMNLKAREAEQKLAFQEREFQQKLTFQEREFQQELAFKAKEHAMKIQQGREELQAKVETAQVEGAVKLQTAEQEGAIATQEHEQNMEQSQQAHEQSMAQAAQAAEQAKKEKPDAKR